MRHLSLALGACLLGNLALASAEVAWSDEVSLVQTHLRSRQNADGQEPEPPWTRAQWGLPPAQEPVGRQPPWQVPGAQEPAAQSLTGQQPPWQGEASPPWEEPVGQEQAGQQLPLQGPSAQEEPVRQDPARPEQAGQRPAGRKPPAVEDPALQNDAAGTLQQFSGIPVYGYFRVKSNENNTWMILFPKSHTRAMLFEACRGLRAPALCNYVGHPEEGGMAFISVIAPEPELRTSIITSCEIESQIPGGPCSARYIEVDGITYLDQPDEYPSLRTYVPQPGGRGDESKLYSWGLDRIDGRGGLDGSHAFDYTGKGLHVFHLDTGIVSGLDEFEGRVIPTFDMTVLAKAEDGKVSPAVCHASDAKCALDKQGHGTHTAGTIGSKTFGVATQATIHAVKILDDDGFGSWASFIGAFDHVMNYCKRKHIQRAVLSASLGGSGPTVAVTEAVDQAVAQGIVVVVASGNQHQDACKYLPAAVPNAITVGSTDKEDKMSEFSNYGACVDIYAPGTNINSVNFVPGSAPLVGSGTSMSAPHVAGVALLLLEKFPNLTAADVQSKLKHTSTLGCMKRGKQPMTKEENKILYFGKDKTRKACRAPAAAADADAVEAADAADMQKRGFDDDELRGEDWFSPLGQWMEPRGPSAQAESLAPLFPLAAGPPSSQQPYQGIPVQPPHIPERSPGPRMATVDAMPAAPSGDWASVGGLAPQWISVPQGQASAGLPEWMQAALS